MTKIMFTPLRLLGGVLAGVIGRRTFATAWGLIDNRPAPVPEQREASWRRLALALAMQGAIFGLIRGSFDRGSRAVFSRFTGRWPGEERGTSV
jgi:hypothetical protein